MAVLHTAREGLSPSPVHQDLFQIEDFRLQIVREVELKWRSRRSENLKSTILNLKYPTGGVAQLASERRSCKPVDKGSNPFIASTSYLRFQISD